MSMSMTLQPADEEATGALGGVVAAALQAANMTMNFILSGLALGVGDGSLRMVMNIAMAFSDINEPVTIEAPLAP